MNGVLTPSFWMKMATSIAEASTCRAKVGCIIVHKNQIVGHGYVGSVHSDFHCNAEDAHILVETDRKGSTTTGTTCIRTVHAEVNAALKCVVRGSKDGGWLECYSTYQPCLDCLKILLQIGVRNFFYMNPYKDEWRDRYVKELNSWVFYNGDSSELTIQQVEIV